MHEFYIWNINGELEKQINPSELTFDKQTTRAALLSSDVWNRVVRRCSGEVGGQVML